MVLVIIMPDAATILRETATAQPVVSCTAGIVMVLTERYIATGNCCRSEASIVGNIAETGKSSSIKY
ncbi:MAG: hypothetical protein HC849_31145 [Oscillatoriales cyanobacterium RU_3_3]|nr:hypothetical protein [Oscillatoriales cyanobacterium RU_3_3]NJR26340.1 hypothetical protein [Richelia sp. CSU_2_1]